MLNVSRSFQCLFNNFRNKIHIKMENNNFVSLSKAWKGQGAQDGDGVKLTRIIGTRGVPDVDPFLLLDGMSDFKLPGGFPDHPHRGFETVTYIKQGKVLHEDFTGYKGEISTGDIQWMTAGKGIVHSEMPYSATEGTSGFQLWINLKKDKKMIEPYYQEIKNADIPVVKVGNNSVKLISGTFNQVIGACKSNTPIHFYDVEVEDSLSIDIPSNMSGFIYVYDGEGVNANNIPVQANYACRILPENKEGVLNLQSISSVDKAKLLVIFGQPINEPVARHGPFVMNSDEEVYQAFNDYKSCKNGFEHAKTWKSQIQNMK